MYKGTKKTTAFIEYRSYIPYGWFAFKFCHVDFSGYNKDDFEDGIKRDYHEEFHTQDKLEASKEYDKKIEDLKREKEELENELKRTGFFKFNKRNEIKCDINDIEETIWRTKNEKEENTKRPDVYDEHRFYRKWLERNGFILEESYSDSSECATNYEKYIRTE